MTDNPLDELRADIIRGVLSPDVIWRKFDAFEAAHPGLRDFTYHCPNCERAGAFDGELVSYWWGAKGVCSSIVLCPACAKEATDG